MKPVIRLLAVLPVVWFFVPHGADADPRAVANPFQMRVVDQQTGQGVAHVRVTSDNGLVCYTLPNGSVRWTESSLMDRDVSFRVDGPDAKRSVKVHVQPGGRSPDIYIRR